MPKEQSKSMGIIFHNKKLYFNSQYICSAVPFVCCGCIYQKYLVKQQLILVDAEGQQNIVLYQAGIRINDVVQPNILVSLQQRKPRRGCRGWWGHNRHGEFRVNHTYHTSDAKGAPTEASEDTSAFNKEKV